MRTYFVYILSSKSHALYVGVTNDLQRRVAQHRHESQRGFCGRYQITWLVYCEESSSPADAIAREKQIKSWSREKKLRLIASINPGWRDLSEETLE